MSGRFGFAPAEDRPIPYLDRIRRYYKTLGYGKPYEWAHYVETPFAALEKPLAAARVAHHEKSSTRNWLATRVFFRDLLVYCRKHHGAARMLLLWLLSRPQYWLMCLKHRQRQRLERRLQPSD